MNTYDLWLWIWLVLLLLLWAGAMVFAAWTDRRRPRRVTRDWQTEQRCKVSRRAFKTRAGLKS
jgi:hypothetical protein